jgi:hypothetical protein
MLWGGDHGREHMDCLARIVSAYTMSDRLRLLVGVCHTSALD